MPFRRNVLVFLLCVSACFFAGPSQTSPGDREPAYRACVSECGQTVCADPSSPPPSPLIGKSRFQPLPQYLKWLFWTCRENCEYQCMHEIVAQTLRIHRAMDRAEKELRGNSDEETEEEGDFSEEHRRRQASPTIRSPIYQYHGKWPFIRVFGMQEFFSVLFSLGNALAHFLGYRALKRHFLGHYSGYYMNPLLKLYYAISLLAWIASAIFHARDTPLTEKLDYFLAIASIAFTLYLSLVRIFKLQSLASRNALAGPFLLLTLRHLNYLAFRSFDYRWNMMVGIGLIVAFNLSWTLWYLLQRKRSPVTRHYTWKVQAFVIFFSLAAALEVLDFPPWALLIDAHALWHACTIPLVFLWYRFLLDDSLYEASHLALASREAA